MLELYHNDMSVCAQKVRIVLAEKNVEWRGHHLNLRAGDQFKPKFLKLNPKAVVPVIVHSGRAIAESNIISEYLEEVFPEPHLMPADPGDRAMVRKWMIRLDGGLHMQVASISFAVAFRHQVLAARPTPEALEEYYRAVPDYGRRLAMREMIEQGFESLNLQIAVKGYEKLLADMDQALEEHPWLVGDRWSLADIAYLPYIVRLEHLQLQHWWADRPKLAGWLERAKAMNSYKKGMVEWFNPKYLELMKAEGEAAWPRIQALLEQP